MTTEQSGGVGETRAGRSTRKGPSAFRTIGEASEELGVPQHVLRFWETKFSQLKPLKRAGGRRYYRPEDMELLTRIRDLLYQEGFTIKGAKRSLSQKGGAKPAPPKEEAAETAAEPETVEEAGGAPDLAEDLVEEAAVAEPEPSLPADPPAAPLFASLPENGSDDGEVKRLRSALEELHRDLSLLRQQISDRLS